MSVLIDVYKVWSPQPAAQVEPAATPSRPIAPVENSPTALLIRRIAEALAQDASPTTTARLPSLTPLRPTLSESTVRVAPMSESVTMQNNGDRELGALATLERMVCMDERLHDLARSNGDSPRETTARRWILAGCRSCGQCAEMAT